MTAFAAAFGLIFVAELADKSRIVALMLVAAFRAPGKVFLGLTLGFLVLDWGAVVLGAQLAGWARPSWLEPAAGAAFILAGAASLLAPESSSGKAQAWLERGRAWGPVVVSFLAVAAAELLDRTQIACAALAAETGRPYAVLAGAMTALSLLNALTVAAGQTLMRLVPMRAVYVVSGLLFIGTGAWLLLRAF